ncbi:hypothetical protein LAZ67_X004807 [Cordylochernes scorpioides]|uniref:Uncharacterized protein n=1 Tax=Cordylochernes scorpioides TaxID=51811 RepID=A0ABY6LXI6_9ARAC|nr:hypothetical protein LAZ67_X004807 [Cordylochernes scorpioides]
MVELSEVSYYRYVELRPMVGTSEHGRIIAECRIGFEALPNTEADAFAADSNMSTDAAPPYPWSGPLLRSINRQHVWTADPVLAQELEDTGPEVVVISCHNPEFHCCRRKVPYSPDMVSFDFWQYPKFKRPLKRK